MRGDLSAQFRQHQNPSSAVEGKHAQHFSLVIQPALASDKWVVCDRFTDASFAYQGGGRGIAAEHIAHLEAWIQQDIRPDLTLLLDAPTDLALKRAGQRAAYDRIEQETYDFFERVRRTYLQRAEVEPQRFRVIDASATEAEVAAAIIKALDEFVTQL